MDRPATHRHRKSNSLRRKRRSAGGTRRLMTRQAKKSKSSTAWEGAETPSNTRWDETPGRPKGSETPGATPGQSTRMWDATPGHATPGAVTPGRETPGHQGTPSARRNRWDETPRTERGMQVLQIAIMNIRLM